MREIADEYNDTFIYPDKVRLNCIDPLYRTGEEDEVAGRRFEGNDMAAE